MNKIEVENLFASILKRWMTGDVSNFERDYAEDLEVDWDGEKLFLEDLKKRVIFFHERFQIIESKIEDFIYDYGGTLGVRLKMQLRNKQTEEHIEEDFYWLYQMKNNQATKFWSIINYSFGFDSPEKL
ncbi:MAG: hypothetical protein S4CHLAM7_10690 [Chlamydiae bacterium]|nr:hypothetical protein [Chlamydiota bacterium]